MNKYLKINDKMIIREEDSMIFSAKDMKIFKFNEKGFKVIELINEKEKLTKEELLTLLGKDFSLEELDTIVNKMIDNKIVFENEE